MAYDITLEKRIDNAAAQLEMRFKKKKMFGGLAYFTEGSNMAFAIRKDELLFRVHDVEVEEFLEREGLHTAIMGGRLMQNWLQAGGKALGNDSLQELLTTGYDYALALPPKH